MTEATIEGVPAGEALALQSALAGRYVVERELGRGGMGVVYLARDLSLDRAVAIKLLPPALAAVPDLRERFVREARTAAGLSHPNIVPIHAVEEGQGLVYYVMGYVDGETRTQRGRRVGPLPPAAVGRVLQEAAWALGYAHGRGIVHRDVKPDNLMIERATGRALLSDFGIARSAAAAPMTAVGESLGTPHYMSPEQAAGETLDGRSDLYALGAVGYFALTGQPPFDAPNAQAVMAMHLTRALPPVATLRPGVPPKLAAVVERALAKEPGGRFATGEALVAALQAAQVPAAEIAPEVRSFQRAAELTVVQVVTLVGVLIAVAELRFPTGGRVLLVGVAFLAVLVLQLTARARALLRSGFGYEDVRALFASEARERDEMAAAARGDSPRRRPAAILAAILVTLAGLAVGVPSSHGTTRNRIGWVLVYSGVGLALLGTVLRLSRTPGFAQRPQRIAGRVWMGPVGRWLFRLAGTGAGRTATGPAGATRDNRVSALIGTLPTTLRARTRELAQVVKRLEGVADSESARERELARVLAETESGTLGGDGDAALAAHRARATAELTAAADAARSRRARSLAALEGIRLQLLLARSGVGAERGLDQETEGARALLRELTPPSRS